MFIPSLKKFEFNSISDRYEKRIIYNDHIYKISISNKKWNECNRRSINRWLKTHKNLSSVTFPYGYIVHEKDINIQDVLNNGCEFCGKKCSDFKGKRRHMKSCRYSNISPANFDCLDLVK